MNIKTLLSNHRVGQKRNQKRKLEKISRQMNIKIQNIKIHGMQQKIVLREFYTNKCL